MHCKDVLAKLSHGQGCVHFARADARQLVCDVLEQCTYFRGLKATRRGARICARQTADSCRHRNAPVSRTASGRAMLMKAADVSLFRAVVVAVQRSAIFAKPSARVCRLARQLLCPTGAAQCGIAEDTQHVLEQIGQRGPVTRPVPSRAILKQIPAHETRSSGRTEAARVYFVRGRPTALAILTASERSVGKHPFDQPDEHGRPGIKRSHEVSHVFDGAKCVRVVHCQVDADAVVPDDLSASGEFVSTATYRQRWHPADYLSRRVARQSRAESAVGNGENALRRKRRVARLDGAVDIAAADVGADLSRADEANRKTHACKRCLELGPGGLAMLALRGSRQRDLHGRAEEPRQHAVLGAAEAKILASGRRSCGEPTV